MKKMIKMLAITAAAAVLLASCQDLFMTSVFSFVEPDISTMNEAQQISYAEDLLVNGTEEELQAAYTAIEELINDIDASDGYSEDELDLLVLGADLAIGASGIGEAIDTAFESLTDPDADPATLADTFLDSFLEDDYQDLENAIALIEIVEVEDRDLITPEQYTNAAVAQLLVVFNEIGGAENVDTIVEGTEFYEDLEQARRWAEAGGFDTSLLGDNPV